VIDFRYHLVSIVAVFLALAIGIVVGATALQPHALAVLERASSHEEQEITQARTKNSNLQNVINADQSLEQALAPISLHNLLTGQKVVLVTAPGADPATISGITSALKQAGATVTGQAALQPAFFDTIPGTENRLNALAQQDAPPGYTPGGKAGQPDPIARIAGQQAAAQVISAALVTTDSPGSTDLPASQVKTILSDFSQYLQVTPANGSSTLAQATLAVMVIPANPPTAGDTDPANLALISLGEQLSTAGRGVVLAGSLPGSGAGSAIDELIYGGTGIQLSSVDDANYEDGQILVAQALSYLLLGHKAAAYGVLADAVPTPAPTPSPTPSPTPTPTSTPTHKSHG